MDIEQVFRCHWQRLRVLISGCYRKRGSRCAAKEAAAAGLHWTFAPMVDISWDARWGAVMEGAEDPGYYGSLVAKARVHGFTGRYLSKKNTIFILVC